MLSYIGVDPGLSGAYTHLYECGGGEWRLFVADIPLLELESAAKKKRHVVNLAGLSQAFKNMPTSQAIIERVQSMPGQGVSSTFRFGEAYGSIQASIVGAGHRLWYVTPAAWKKEMRLGRDKEKARHMALTEFPECAEFFSRKRDHGRAEAALIALYKLRWDWDDLDFRQVLPCTRMPTNGSQAF